MIDPAVIRASALRGDTRYPYAAWMPIPEAAEQPRIVPRLLIFHSQAGPKMTSLENLHAYVSRDDVHIEPTFILDLDGRMAQLVDIFTRADCNAKANPFATSVETQDRGSATLASTAWSDPQVEQLAGLTAWMHLHPLIRLPLAYAKTWDGSGVGPHRQFPEWSVYVGKTCPGNTRVAQIPLVVSRAEAVVASPPSPLPPPPMSEEDEMIKLIVQVPNDPLRTGALVAMDGGGTEMIGFSSEADRAAIVGAVGAPVINVTAQQYDDFIAHALAG